MLLYHLAKRKNPLTKKIVYSAQLQKMQPITAEHVIERIEKKCTLTSPDVKAVLDALEEEIILALLAGHSIRLGNLGSFRTTLKSRSTDSPEEFEPTALRTVAVRFTPSSSMARAMNLKTGRVQLLRTDAPKKPSHAPAGGSTPAPAPGA